MLKLVKELNKNSNTVSELYECGDKMLGSENNLLHVTWQQDVTEMIGYEKDQCSWNFPHTYMNFKYTVLHAFIVLTVNAKYSNQWRHYWVKQLYQWVGNTVL